MATVRKARKSDLENVEYVCRMTAGEDAIADEAVGKAISKTYSTYYIRECTDTCFVLADDNDKAVGYVLCETDYRRFRKAFRKVDVPVVYSILRKMGILAWLLPVPYTFFGIKYPAHLHIDILPEYQNKGYGGILIKTLFEELESKGIKGVMLTADSHNTGAIRFYERLGFKTLVKSEAIRSIIMAKNF